MITERALIARYFHRLGFGPKPGEFQKALTFGASTWLEQILNAPVNEPSNYPKFEKIGPRPSNNLKRAEWNLKMREQRTTLVQDAEAPAMGATGMALWPSLGGAVRTHHRVFRYGLLQSISRRVAGDRGAAFCAEPHL